MLIFNLISVVIQIFIVCVANGFAVFVDPPVVVLNALLKVFDILRKAGNLLSEGFKGNENVGGFVDVVFIIRLDNNILAEVKIVDSLLIVCRRVTLQLSSSSEAHSSESS